MRKAINENPLVQGAVVVVLAVVAGFLILTRVAGGGGSESESTPTPSSESASATSTAPAAGATESSSATPSEPTTPEATTTAPESAASTPEATTTPADAASPPAAGSVATSFVPGPGLPPKVVIEYARNKAVALLVVRRSGIDDRAVRKAVEQLRNRPDVAVFVTQAKDVARYARITEGVNVNRVPALVVLRPRRLTGNVPTAAVSYGFRAPESVVQAVEDAFYKGRSLPYYPE